jgi:hypothetical protein
VKIGILYNCQHQSLRMAMAALRPDDEPVSFELTAVGRDPAAWAEVAGVLLRCDHIVTMNVAPHYGPLATAALRATGRPVHLVPSLQFAGFYPDTIDLKLDHHFVPGPTGSSHSRIAVAGFLAGLTARETAGLFNRLGFSRLGYFNWFPEQKFLLLERYQSHGIDLRAAFENWLARGCFMHDANHPRMRVMLDLARAACAKAGLAPLEPLPDEAALPDPLADFDMHPVFPDIAAAIGIAPSGAFRAMQVPGTQKRAMGTESFVRASHAAFARVPLGVLRGGDGVLAAMRALGLSEAPRRRAALHVPTETETAFLSWHGTVLGIETASAMLVQRRLVPDDADSTDLVAELPELPLAETAVAVQMGGAIIAPAELPGCVTFQREDAYLCAVPGDVAARFDRTRASGWESFLPMRASELANWRAIAAGHWTIEGERQRVPASAIHMGDGFAMVIGSLKLDLRRARAVWQERPSGAAAWRITMDGKTYNLMQDRGARPRDEQRLMPHAPMHRPGEIATPEEFRVARDATLRIHAPPELLHPPLTCCDADRDWLHEQYFDGAGGVFHKPTAGQTICHALLVRGSNKLLMLERGVEGVLVDDRGIAKDAGFLLEPPQMPASLRAVGNVRLLDRAAIADAPVIDGPVCVFYNPNLQNYFHFVAEALLALHVMAPLLPPAARLVLPGTLAEFRRTGSAGFDHAALMTELGFGQFPTIELNAPFARLRDAVWIDSDAVFGMPAAVLQGFRARAHAMHAPRQGKARKLFIRRGGSRQIGNAAALEQLLAPAGFQTVALENMPAGEQIQMFADAEFVIAAHGSALANTIFCPPGARIMELTPACEFRPYFWLMAEKLGLNYGVLPCDTSDGGFNSTLKANVGKFRSLFRMLALAG